MHTYQAYNYEPSKLLLKELFGLLIFIILAFLVDTYLLDKRFSYVSVGITAVYILVRILRVEKVKTISFDEKNKEIKVLYTKFWKERTETLSFAEVNIEAKKNKSRFLFAEPITLYLLKGYVEYFEINEVKDGFTLETLEAIIDKSKSLSIPLEEKS